MTIKTCFRFVLFICCETLGVLKIACEQNSTSKWLIINLGSWQILFLQRLWFFSVITCLFWTNVRPKVTDNNHGRFCQSRLAIRQTFECCEDLILYWKFFPSPNLILWLKLETMFVNKFSTKQTLYVHLNYLFNFDK